MSIIKKQNIMRRYIVLPYSNESVTEYEKQKWIKYTKKHPYTTIKSKGITYKEGKIIWKNY